MKYLWVNIRLWAIWSLVLPVLAILLGIGGCERNRLDLQKLPETLPYRMIDYCPYSGHVYGICLDQSCTPAVYEIQNGNIDGHQSSVIIAYLPASTENRITQINTPTTFYNSHLAVDLDRDGVDELLYTYYDNDTAYLGKWDHQTGYDNRIAAISGSDRSGDDHWVGKLVLGACGDVNGDNNAEVLMVAETGYDRFPREVICLDWAHDTTLWRFQIAGHGCSSGMAVSRDSLGRKLVVFGVAAPDNGVVRNGQADSLSYLFCVDQDGAMLWSRVCGGAFSSVHPVLLTGPDGTASHIICEQSSREPGGTATCCMMLINMRGEVQDSVVLSSPVRLTYPRSLEGDGSVLINVVLENNQWLVFDGDLNLLDSFANATIQRFDAHGDFLDNGSTHYLVGLVGGQAALLSTSGELMALSSEGGLHGVVLDETGRSSIVRYGAQRRSFIVMLEKTPWTLVFSRHPILAFLAAVIPLGTLVLIVWYVLAIRQKNRFIKQQQEAIDRTTAELQKAQGKLIDAEKHKLAKDMAGGFAHEIRNTLFPARAWIAMQHKALERGEHDAERLSRSARRINSAVKRAVSLTDVILKYVKLDSEVQAGPTNLHSIVMKVIETNSDCFASQLVDVIVEVPPGTMVRHNPEHLFLVLNNVVINSLDAMSNREDGSRLAMSCQPSAEGVQLVVQDNGCGVALENIDRVFDPFFSTKPDKGTGLGLALARKIVMAYRGSIEMASTCGEGTAVTLWLPDTGKDIQ